MIIGARPSGATAPHPRYGKASLRQIIERRGLTGTNGERVSRSLMVASGICIAALLALIFTVPLRQELVARIEHPIETHTIVLPEEFQEPLAPPPPVQEIAHQVIQQPVAVNSPEQLDMLPRRHEEPPKVDPNAGKTGRDRAREATARLASTGALDGALSGLTSALSQSTSDYSSLRRRSRNVRSGRSGEELGAVGSGTAGSGTSDLTGSKVDESLVSVGSLAAPTDAAASPAEESNSRGAAPGVYRSNASLLAVIQRYAAGIQFCYVNELKREPSLRGKLVVAVTVAPSGEVLEASVIRNTAGSDRLVQCALSQIRQWKFPAIASGITTFQAPFVFTPPS